jgi:hypothetical protein
MRESSFLPSTWAKDREGSIQCHRKFAPGCDSILASAASRGNVVEPGIAPSRHVTSTHGSGKAQTLLDDGNGSEDCIGMHHYEPNIQTLACCSSPHARPSQGRERSLPNKACQVPGLTHRRPVPWQQGVNLASK